MNEKLCDLIKATQKGDDNSVIKLFECFNSVLNKYNRKLRCFYTGIDLNIFFIELIYKLKLNDNLITDEQIYSYIYRSLKNEYIKLSKKQASCKELPFDNIILDDKVKSDFYSNIEINELINKLKTKERHIIKAIYYNNKTEIALANELGISRQAVNKIKLKALKKLKFFLYSFK